MSEQRYTERDEASPLTRLAREAAKIRADLPLALLDVALIAAGYTAVLILRFDGAVPADYWLGFGAFLPAALAIHLGANAVAGLYGKVWLHASVSEARRVLWAGVIAAAALAFALVPAQRPVPASVVILGVALSPMLVGVLRFHSRLFAFQRRRAEFQPQRVVVVGAGEAGAAVIRDMLRRPDAGYEPVAILDDDPRMQRRDLANVPVVGDTGDLPAAIRRHRADLVLLAVPSADGALVRKVANAADEAALPVKLLPAVDDLVGGEIGVRDVRDLEITDLLGREQVATDLDEVRAMLAGRRVLVTGAGGSIGSEIARQVVECEPSELLLLDNDETHLHDAAATLPGPSQQLLADVRDADRVAALFERHRPEVVFHAAALKHVPVLETHPGEAVRTNVTGTEHVLVAARRVGVERFVLISTDKAVNPKSVMGASKRLGELLVRSYAPDGAPWCAVRFGNVLGSRGSVIPTFMRQIAQGGPVTVTDPDMTRFFMSIEEAVQLVLQASVYSDGGEVFMLDMGEPVRIIDLAERMIRLSGRRVGDEIPIHITGLRPGEKLVEELRAPEEAPAPTPHPSIVSLRAATLRLSAVERIDRLAALAKAGDDDEVRPLLLDLVGSLEPAADGAAGDAAVRR